MRELYRPLFLNETPFVFTKRRTSELIKCAANAFLAMKINFIKEMTDWCEVMGADVQEVARGIGLDNRIGKKFLNVGPGYGGSCFPKDTQALARTAARAGTPVRLVESVIDINVKRKKAMAAKVIAACGGDVVGKTIAMLGLTFKLNTDDMLEVRSLDIIPPFNMLARRCAPSIWPAWRRRRSCSPAPNSPPPGPICAQRVPTRWRSSPNGTSSARWIWPASNPA